MHDAMNTASSQTELFAQFHWCASNIVVLSCFRYKTKARSLCCGDSLGGLPLPWTITSPVDLACKTITGQTTVQSSSNSIMAKFVNVRNTSGTIFMDARTSLTSELSSTDSWLSLQSISSWKVAAKDKALANLALTSSNQASDRGQSHYRCPC